MLGPTSPTFSIGGTSLEPSSSEAPVPRARDQTDPQNTAPDFGKESLDVRNYVLLDSLLPSPESWDKICRDNRKSRIRFLVVIGFLYVLLSIAHAPLAIWKAWSLSYHAELRRLLSDRPGLGQPLPASCIITSCAALCPEPSKTRDWYTLYGIPYATLPQQKSYFSSATYPFTFKECYLAYWHGVSQYKRTFVNGQIRFFGKQAFDDESECAQMKLRNGTLVPVGKPQSCLSLSFHFPWFKESHRSSAAEMPIVAYIGGSYLMSHRPRLISSKLAAELHILYVVINYRLGVFGFSDFGSEGAGPNQGVSDVREALMWIHENAHRFGADSTHLMLYGEDSGATIAAALFASSGTESIVIRGVRRPLFTHLWLADGSVVIPDVPDSKDAFQELLLNDPDLEAICREWSKDYADIPVVRSQPTGRKLHCLSNMTVSEWLRKTPIEWIHSRRADLTLLPQADEVRTSLIKRDLGRSRVENPLGMLRPSASSRSTIRDMPVVIYSSMNPPYNLTIDPNNSEHWTLSETERNVKDALNTFRKPVSQLPYANAIWNAYQRFIQNFIAWRKEDQAPSDINYRAIYDIMRTDLRGTCTYNVYAKHLQLSSSIRTGPIYRILNRIRSQPYVDEEDARCDIPFFLIDDEFECGTDTKPRYESLAADQKEVLIRAFVQFVYYGEIKGARKLQYPIYGGMSPIESTYNILTEMGLTTAGSRETSLFSACQLWVSELGEFQHVMKYARMN